MASKRPSTPPPRELDSEMMKSLPESSPRSSDAALRGTVLIGPEHALVPPSPGLKTFEIENQSHRSTVRKSRARIGARVQKTVRQKHSVFRFLDLPGEIRNMVYTYTHSTARQALLVHRPRLASLRSRTRLDRARPLASEIAGHEHDKSLSLTKRRRSMQYDNRPGGLTRETNRPFVGLTQVCQLLRAEFRPIYLRRQEIGMDLTEIINYLQTFYSDAEGRLALLERPGVRKQDLPFTGNLTIAVGDKPNAAERDADGIDVSPLLNIWANSYRIEAGFGRYHSIGYVPECDGEAKDLYRLFGRRVLRNRNCSAMNMVWRAILRTCELAAVRIHRQPAESVKPYIHIIFKKESAEPWMTDFESPIPTSPDWLYLRGFQDMEHFDIRVGVQEEACSPDDASIALDLSSIT